MKKNKLEKILFITSIIFYVVIGIIVLTYANKDFESENGKIYAGIAMLLSGIPHMFTYVIDNGYKNFNKSSYFIFGLIAVCFGIVFMSSAELNIEFICVIWGAFDIIRGAFELRDNIPEIKENKLEIIETFCMFGDIVLGILLCAHLVHGIELHLIYMGLSYFLIAVKKILDVALGLKKED